MGDTWGVNGDDHSFQKSLEEQLAECRQVIGELRLALDATSSIDPITGLLNRNGLIDAVRRAQDWLVRHHQPFGVALVSIPSLAATGSERVHWAGLIRHTGAILAGALRAVDEVGRLDDHSFVVVFRPLLPEHIPPLTLRIREALRGSSELDDTESARPRLVFILVADGPSPEADLILNTLDDLGRGAEPDKPTVVNLSG